MQLTFPGGPTFYGLICCVAVVRSTVDQGRHNWVVKLSPPLGRLTNASRVRSKSALLDTAVLCAARNCVYTYSVVVNPQTLLPSRALSHNKNIPEYCHQRRECEPG